MLLWQIHKWKVNKKHCSKPFIIFSFIFKVYQSYLSRKTWELYQFRACVFQFHGKFFFFFRIIENFNTPKNNIRGTFVNNKFLGGGDFEVGLGISLFFGGKLYLVFNSNKIELWRFFWNILNFFMIIRKISCDLYLLRWTYNIILIF